MPSRVAITQSGHHERTAISVRISGNLVDKRVGDFAGRQIEVRLELPRDRTHYVGERSVPLPGPAWIFFGWTAETVGNPFYVW